MLDFPDHDTANTEWLPGLAGYWGTPLSKALVRELTRPCLPAWEAARQLVNTVYVRGRGVRLLTTTIAQVAGMSARQARALAEPLIAERRALEDLALAMIQVQDLRLAWELDKQAAQFSSRLSSPPASVAVVTIRSVPDVARYREMAHTMRARERHPMGHGLAAELYGRTALALAHDLARATVRSVNHTRGLAESVFATQQAIEDSAVAMLQTRDLAVAALLEAVANRHQGVWAPYAVPGDLPYVRANAQQQQKQCQEIAQILRWLAR